MPLSRDLSMCYLTVEKLRTYALRVYAAISAIRAIFCYHATRDYGARLQTTNTFAIFATLFHYFFFRLLVVYARWYDRMPVYTDFILYHLTISCI